MGNRAIIIAEEPTDKKPAIGIYVHWNGGPESVLGFLEACKSRGYADPSDDPAYALARLCGAIHEFFGITDSASLGLEVVTKESWDNVKELWLDNGVYLIGEDWTIKEWRTGSLNGRSFQFEDLDDSDKKKSKGICNRIIFGRLVYPEEDE